MKMMVCGPRYPSAILAVALALLLMPDPASAQSSLQARRQRVREQMNYARARAREAVDEAARLRQELRACQQRLARIQAQVRETQARIRQTKDSIVKTSEELQRTEQEIERQEAVVDSRIVALEKSGSGSLVCAFLGSEDMTEVVECAYVGKKILNSDVELLRTLEDRKRQAELAKQRLKKLQEELEQEEIRLKEAQREAAVETERQNQLLQRQNALVRQWQQELDALAAESRAIERQLQGLGSRGYSGVWRGSFARPVDGILTSGFGPRGGRIHEGVDLAAPTGTPVRAAGAGKVVFAGWRSGYGNCIVIDHGGGRATVYGHLSAIGARAGSVVSSGQHIGAVGSTGRSTGPHLHFEVRQDGKAVNPLR